MAAAHSAAGERLGETARLVRSGAGQRFGMRPHAGIVIRAAWRFPEWIGQPTAPRAGRRAENGGRMLQLTGFVALPNADHSSAGLSHGGASGEELEVDHEFLDEHDSVFTCK